MITPSVAAQLSIPSGAPAAWEVAWGTPSPFYRRHLLEIRLAVDALAADMKVVDEEAVFGSLVSPSHNTAAPVHRWFNYKEAFSYRLPREVLRRLGAGQSRVVADVFGGVATTALSLAPHPALDAVVSIEYSPLAVFVGATKLRGMLLRPHRLLAAAHELLTFPVAPVDPPELAAFHNRDIWDRRVLTKLLSAREFIHCSSLRNDEKAFFLLGLAAITEDLSGVMKDGRALRILRDRHRIMKGLSSSQSAPGTRDRVRVALWNQWLAMIDDVEAVSCAKPGVSSKACHVRGDARHLDRLRRQGASLLPDNGVGLFVYSPPYLNCIDYTEVYKLELWMLEFVQSQEQFRRLRLGTLRSHPSIEFPSRPYLDAIEKSDVAAVVRLISRFLERHHVRPAMGRMVRNYFDDMYATLAEQYRCLEDGGHAVCVVGNSTFSRREPTGDGWAEVWRLPILTDVIIGRIAEAIGFRQVELWRARELRPRNVNAGYARESLVVCRK